ncbi:hypothetical protein PISMIDRAFT_93841, partial [Pisolithus microcarpus 441]
LKALYQKAFCLWAIDLDEAGEAEIYKINLLEAMMMVMEAWNNVQSTTIVNCWNHTKIQPEVNNDIHGSAHHIMTSHPSPMADINAWMVIHTFIMSDELSLPGAECQLHNILGDCYLATDWDLVLKVVMDADNNITRALEGLNTFTLRIFSCDLTQLTHSHTPQVPATPMQLSNVEQDLSTAVDNLKQHRQIIGMPLTLDEMLNPVEEEEVGCTV